MLHAIVLAAAVASPSPSPTPTSSATPRAARSARLLSDLVAVERLMTMFRVRFHVTISTSSKKKGPPPR